MAQIVLSFRSTKMIASLLGIFTFNTWQPFGIMACLIIVACTEPKIGLVYDLAIERKRDYLCHGSYGKIPQAFSLCFCLKW